MTGLAQHGVGDLLLEGRELERLDPRGECVDRHVADVGDRASSDANIQRIGLELRALTVATLLRRLILPQEHADVLLVSLVLEVREEGEDALESSRFPAKQL